eukprot:TRINITY_DN35582_c0_g1_i1.p1 TRINITY_DN35582_c0_g1~~TRINITY_DN35582_c0_g1_i1.p1  ORF type:complete len:330 (+),score=19.87 TRINITY_DN35582_c0_g1_i1:49-1038(+)
MPGYDVAVVGGGLSGLLTAWRLASAGVNNIILLEGDLVVGGRLKGTEAVDGGAAWVWPQSNKMTVKLIEELGLHRMAQVGAPRGQERVKEGMYELPRVLQRKLGHVVRTGVRVTSISETPTHIKVTTSTNEELICRTVVLAVPPRVAAKHIAFSPRLPGQWHAAMSETPSWMSKVSKAVLVWGDKWWDSWDVFGGAYTKGPGFQFYDGSAEGVKCIVAFCSGEYTDEVILRQVLSFHRGKKTSPPPPISITRYSWATDPLINENPADLSMHHLTPNPALSIPLYANRLVFASSETSMSYPGYIEGAVDSAERAAAQVLNVLSRALNTEL